ncbi:MAG: AAA family ATPase [Myxococcales bacterium]|nr:AAA family ATPase [Myxococcales bacterium]
MAGRDKPGHRQPPHPPPQPVLEEQTLLARVNQSLQGRGLAGPRRRELPEQYARELIGLRDEIAEARLEDVPALVAQMERLQEVGARRVQVQELLVDTASPYFGHLRLREQVAGRAEVTRDVLIGRATFIDPKARVNIVDWRDAPASQLYYRYEEGDDYAETFGTREVEGVIEARRTVTITEGKLLRVATAEEVWVPDATAPAGWRVEPPEVASLQGGELTARRPDGTGVLGAGPGGQQRLDRHLPEIAALIDPRQFELITKPSSGLVVIQGGAGSGKTTIGLHRIAYLNFNHPEAFSPKRMLVVTFGAALAAYISQVLPALGVEGVRVVTFGAWAVNELGKCLPALEFRLVEDSPPAVTRVKSHPAVLHELERRTREALADRRKLSRRATLELWAELMTDKPALLQLLTSDPEMPLPAADVEAAHEHMGVRTAALLERDASVRREERIEAHRRERFGAPEDDEVRGDVGVDGERTEDRRGLLDLEDVALLLRVHQLLHGPRKELAHLFVDEAQDLSPVELAVLIGGASKRRSVTLAGDTAQRLFLDNGFGDWRSVLRHLGLAHVAVEPLRIAYRSTRQIMQLARHAMGPLLSGEPPQAPRAGAPVEVHSFTGTGPAVAFLAEALRPLFVREPRATVALLARHPEQADRYFEGLRRAEVPSLRRVRAQEFAFRPGIEVTEIRQVKGLEFDYVVMLDVNATTFGTDDESRHLFHIAATRAAYQLWLLVTDRPSALIPDARDLPPRAP